MSFQPNDVNNNTSGYFSYGYNDNNPETVVTDGEWMDAPTIPMHSSSPAADYTVYPASTVAPPLPPPQPVFYNDEFSDDQEEWEDGSAESFPEPQPPQEYQEGLNADEEQQQQEENRPSKVESLNDYKPPSFQHNDSDDEDEPLRQRPLRHPDAETSSSSSSSDEEQARRPNRQREPLTDDDSSSDSESSSRMKLVNSVLEQDEDDVEWSQEHVISVNDDANDAPPLQQPFNNSNTVTPMMPPHEAEAAADNNRTAAAAVLAEKQASRANAFLLAAIFFLSMAVACAILVAALWERGTS